MADAEQTAAVESLTGRERDILGLLAAGLSDREIAAKRVLSLGTVKWYNHQIYAKLGVSGRTQAIAAAQRALPLEVATPAAASARHNLPAETTRFIGRDREVAEVMDLISRTRLVTLTGSPGTGKTRLGLRIAALAAPAFRDGVCCVELALLSDHNDVARSLADALHVEERRDVDFGDALREHLRDRNMLLVLDNFEHVLPAAVLVSDLLAACPDLKVLTTSREALRIYGEHEYVVTPLQLPDPNDARTIEASESVLLFVQQARTVKSDFAPSAANLPSIAEICIRLEGLPLAIELAAAQSKMFGPYALLQRLQSPLDALTRGSRDQHPRQQTLRQTIDWSYNLLSDGDKALFARLGVFSGGWTIDAMLAVCGPFDDDEGLDGLESLVNKSLVRHYECNGQPRFGMLETLRGYARERLEASGDMDRLRRACAAHFVELAQSAAGKAERVALDELEAEHDNFRAVLTDSLPHAPDVGLRLIASLRQLWRARGHLLEGWRWTQQFLAAGAAVEPAVLAPALLSACMLAQHLGLTAECRELAERALTTARQAGAPSTIAWSLHTLSVALLSERRLDEARARAAEALTLFDAQDEAYGAGKSLIIGGEIDRMNDAFGAAERAYHKALQKFDAVGNFEGASMARCNLGWVMLQKSDERAAREHFAVSLALAREIGDQDAMLAPLAGMIACIVEHGDLSRAATLIGAIEKHLGRLGLVIDEVDAQAYRPYVGRTRATLAPADFERFKHSGAALSLQQAIELSMAQHTQTRP